MKTSEITPERVFGAFDACSDLHGPLSPEARASVFAAMDTPSFAAWEHVRSLIIDPTEMTTLWRAVVDHTVCSVADVPTAGEILTAIERTVSREPTSRRPRARRP